MRFVHIEQWILEMSENDNWTKVMKSKYNMITEEIILHISVSWNILSKSVIIDLQIQLVKYF